MQIDPQLKHFLALAIEMGASDIHISVGAPPVVRLHDRIRPLEDQPRLMPDDTRRLLFSIIDEDHMDALTESGSATDQLDANNYPNAAKAAFAEFLNDVNLDSRQIYFVNQIVEYIVHNGLMKDMSVLQEAPFTDQGSVVEVFTDLSV